MPSFLDLLGEVDSEALLSLARGRTRLQGEKVGKEVETPLGENADNSKLGAATRGGQ